MTNATCNITSVLSSVTYSQLYKQHWLKSCTVQLQCPSNSYSMYYSYKQYWCTVFQDLADAPYIFTINTACAHGKQLDRNSLSKCSTAMISMPDNMWLPTPTQLQFVTLQDEAYKLLITLNGHFQEHKLLALEETLITIYWRGQEQISRPMGWTVRESNPAGGKIFCTHPDQPWGQSSLLYNWYQVFPRGKVARPWHWPPTPISTKVEGRVQLYIYTPPGPSWPVPGWNLIYCYDN
jgi:hypothetical protein